MNTTTARKALSRTKHGRMLAGVASGLAAYSGVDVTLIRIGFALLTILGGAGIPIYLACWLLIPESDSGQSIASDFISDVRESRN
jgi:phage shock protein PspC (stress-responsive transcriptional regulator)